MARPSDSPETSWSNDYRSSTDSSSSGDVEYYYVPTLTSGNLRSATADNRISPGSSTYSGQGSRPQLVSRTGDESRPTATSQRGKSTLVFVTRRDDNPNDLASDVETTPGNDDVRADQWLHDDSPEQGAACKSDSDPAVGHTGKPDSGRPKKQRTPHYEYGDPIGGYKFVSDKPPPPPSGLNDKRPLDEGWNGDVQDDEYIDRHQFDRYKEHKKRRVWNEATATTRNGNPEHLEEAISRYWSRDPLTPTGNMGPGSNFLPIINPGNGETLLRLDDPTVVLESVTPGMLNKFYDKSAAIIGLDKVALLKRERVKWHPDKHRGTGEHPLHSVNKRNVITRLFQVINELWESLQ